MQARKGDEEAGGRCRGREQGLRREQDKLEGLTKTHIKRRGWI
jgi:hypothetical protein